jgi:signal transduction histidine kinase/ligand-binding sensor domain-containing protein
MPNSGHHSTEIPIPLTTVRVLACLWALIALCLCATTAHAQYRFDHWTADNGLPQNSVRDIVQTRDGYLWLTTFDGLVRFDGVRFTVFNKSNSPGIITNRFLHLYEDAEGDLWASTENSGLTRLHHGRFTTYTTENGLPDNVIGSLGGDGHGNLLMFFGFRLYRWFGGSFLPADDLRLPVGKGLSDRVQHLPLASDQVTKVICFVDGQLRTWNLADMPYVLDTYSPLQDGHENTWFNSTEGLIKIRNGQVVKAYTTRDGLPGRETRLVYGRLPLQTLSFSAGGREEGALWLTDLDSMQSHRVAAAPPDGLKIHVSYADKEGNYWFGTLLNGLYRARKQSVTVYTKTQGLIANEVYPIFEDRNGAIWIGTAGNGLFRFKDGAFTNYSGVGSFGDLVTSIDQDRAGQLWVNGGWRFENGRFVSRFGEDVLPESLKYVWTMCEDDDGARWFGMERGVVRYKDGATIRYTTKDGLAGDDTKVIIRDGAGGLWLGSYGGLTHFKNGQFTSWTERDGLPGNTVRALYQDREGGLWIGTYDSGLGRLKDGKFTRYTVKDGLFDSGVFQILEDDQGWFWMSCNRGIYRVRKQELEDFAAGKIQAVTSIAYGKSDGMLNVECNGGRWPAGTKTRDGKLWFPTMGGVAVIDPATVTTNTQPPPVVIEGVRIENQELAGDRWESELRVEPAQHNFEVQYTALSFNNSENLRFKYKLEGLDEDWVDAGVRRTAYFSYVPPGEYTFQVIAANSDGVWNTEGRRLRIIVLPPFYRTWWFLSLALLGVAGAIFAMFKYRVTQLKRRQAAQQAFASRLIESQEVERQRIAAELHDSLGQHLLVICNRAALGERAVDDPAHSKNQFDEITASSIQAINEVRAISQNLRPINLDRLGLSATIEEMVEKVAAASGIQFSADIEALEDGLLTKEQEVNCFRIVQESLNNILKHAGATKAYVELWREHGAVLVTVRDNGRGFAVEATGNGAARGLGLTSIAERLRILGGTLTIKSASGEGTTLDLRIPLAATKGEKDEQ